MRRLYWSLNCFGAVVFTDMIQELISKGQQLDAVHFTYEVGLVNKFPPVPLLKAFLKDAKKAAASIMEDPNNVGRAAVCISSLDPTPYSKTESSVYLLIL